MFDLLDKYFRNYLNLFEIEEIFQGEENGERIIILFKDLYKEIDVEFNNNLTYWEAYRRFNKKKKIE